MDDTFNQNELSAEDLAVLRAFDALDMEEWGAERPDTSTLQPTQPLADQDTTIATTQPELANMLSPEDMLTLFTTEADEDLTTLRRTLQQLEPDDQLNIARLQTLQRTAHKMKGTAGAVGCTAMSSIAHHLEELTRLIISGKVVPFIGLNALVQTVHALEMTLNSFVTHGQESTTPLAELEAEYKALNIDIQAAVIPKNAGDEESMPVRIPFKATEENTSSERATRPLQEHPASAPYVRVDIHRFEQLVIHTEQLVELSAPLENAQAEVEKALHELHAAQGRLHYLETLLSTPLMAKMSNNKSGQAGNDERPTSSLVARILDEAAERTGHNYQRKIKLQPHEAARLRLDQSLAWDELEIDHFTESDVLIHSFSEAIADVATAASQLRIAFAHLNRITQMHMAQAANVRNDTLLLRLAPISTLLPRIERAVTMSAIAQQRQVQFEVEGEMTEIDQDILEELKHPLLQLVRTCVAHSFATPSPSAEQSEDAGSLRVRVWLYARTTGNEVSIEVGLSMPVNGGAVDEVQEAIRRLNGSISARRNAAGGISFYLRLPRSQGSVQGLLVRVGSYRVIVPFSQVQRIDDGRQDLAEPPASLNTLLGFPADQAPPATVQPVLILQPGLTPPAVQVDEVLGEVKLVVKPLSRHLHRRGIAGTAIDGLGNVLLMVDLPELVRYRKGQQPASKTEVTQSDRKHRFGQTQPSILVADDSVYIRQSLLQALSRAGYQVMEARDGMEAIELLLAHPPDVLVLDIEMPNLNGYDLLSIIRAHPELARVKIVMLTSRSSQKHQARAHDLGAHAYLTKPCPQDTLLETLQSLLTN
jgi:chemosensory pili system protein ChpA (sensor histidine kinase/response regulator)